MSSGESALTFDRSAQWASRDPQPRSDAHGRDQAGSTPEAGAAGSEIEATVARHQTLVFRIALRVMGNADDARDVAQEVLLRWLRKKPRNRSSMDGDDRAWLYRVTVNLCRDEFRRRSRAPLVSNFGAEDPAGPMEVVDPEPGADARTEQQQRKRLLETCLMELSDRERMAIVLRDIEELGTRETALAMDVSEVTVRTLAARGRLKLAKLIRKAEGQR